MIEVKQQWRELRRQQPMARARDFARERGVREAGGKANLMYAGVRLGGGRFSPFPWRFGYGHPWPNRKPKVPSEPSPQAPFPSRPQQPWKGTPGRGGFRAPPPGVTPELKAWLRAWAAVPGGQERRQGDGGGGAENGGSVN